MFQFHSLYNILRRVIDLLPIARNQCRCAEMTADEFVREILVQKLGVKHLIVGYDYAFGPQISAHGDCIATYKEYVFMTWYKGGKQERNMMLTRYNTETGSMKTIEFPHRHTGWRNVWYLGESHNTIGVGVSPLDGTIHLLFDI